MNSNIWKKNLKTRYLNIAFPNSMDLINILSSLSVVKIRIDKLVISMNNLRIDWFMINWSSKKMIWIWIQILIITHNFVDRFWKILINMLFKCRKSFSKLKMKRNRNEYYINIEAIKLFKSMSNSNLILYFKLNNNYYPFRKRNTKILFDGNSLSLMLYNTKWLFIYDIYIMCLIHFVCLIFIVHPFYFIDLLTYFQIQDLLIYLMSKLYHFLF